ncbi:MAG: hypothetical protein WBC04_06125 [Candidatus Acidiferrales bacterium]
MFALNTQEPRKQREEKQGTTMGPHSYPFRTAIGLALLLGPALLSRFGIGSKRGWGTYTLVSPGILLTFAVTAPLVGLEMGFSALGSFGEFSGVSFALATLAYVGVLFAESVARKTGRF